MTTGITGFGAYLPRFRLRRAALQELLGRPARSGTRTVASHDEDALTMGVEASRIALAERSHDPTTVWFATTRPPYLDKTNATALAAALRLPDATGAYDVNGSVRSAVGALRAAAATAPSLAVLSDLRYGLPGSSELLEGGDAACAFAFGDDPLAELLAVGSVSVELLDRWRAEGAAGPSTWEERFASAPLVCGMEAATEQALGGAGLAVSDLNHVVISSSLTRAARTVARRFAPDVLAGHFHEAVGYAGAADAGLQLAGVLEGARPDEHILVLVGADGGDAMVFRTTDRVTERRSERSLQRALTDGDDRLSVASMLTWRGLLPREAARRPSPRMPSAPAAARNRAWKFGFVASRCRDCSTRHLPPQRTCRTCQSVDRMAPEPMADEGGTIATFTLDWLAASVSPPSVVAVVDFEGGGRFQCLLTDCDVDRVRIGDPVRMSFRMVDIAGNGVRNYAWKATPVNQER